MSVESSTSPNWEVEALRWEVEALHVGLVERAQALEFEIAAARNANQLVEAERLAGRRNANYYLADALSQSDNLGTVLEGLPTLVALAWSQVRSLEARTGSLRRRYGRDAPVVHAFTGFEVYWRSLAQTYEALEEILRCYIQARTDRRKAYDSDMRKS